MPDHSPATRAARVAFVARFDLCGPGDDHWPELCLAAALRACADQVVPREQETPWGTVIRATKEELGIRGKLLAVVAELVAHDSQ